MDKFYRFARVGVKIKKFSRSRYVYVYTFLHYVSKFLYLHLLFFLPSVGKRSYTENIKNEKSGTNFKRSKQAIKTDPYSDF